MHLKYLALKLSCAAVCLWISLHLSSCHLVFPYSPANNPEYSPYYYTVTLFRDLPGGEEFSEQYCTYVWPDQDYNQDGTINQNDAMTLATAKSDDYIQHLMAPGFNWKKKGASIFNAPSSMKGIDCTGSPPPGILYGGPWGSALSWHDPDGAGPEEIPRNDAYAWIRLIDKDGNEHMIEPLVQHGLINLAERTGRPDDEGNYHRKERHIRVFHMETTLKPFHIGEMEVKGFHIHSIGTILTDQYGLYASFEPDTIHLYMSAEGRMNGESGTTETCMRNDRGTQVSYGINPQYFLFNLDTQFDIGGSPLWVKLKLASNWGKSFNVHQPYVTLPLPENWVRKSPVTLEPYFDADHDNDLEKFLWFENFEAPDERFLGKGRNLQDVILSPGKHEITVVAYDSQGAYFPYTSILTVAPPDNCSDAVLITDGSHSGTLKAAEGDGADSCSFSSGQPDTWFRYRARAPGILSVNTCGTNDLGGQDAGMDAVLSLHTNCTDILGSEIPDGCNDDWVYDPAFPCLGSDNGAALDASLSVPVIGGQDILIRVAANSESAANDFILNISLATEQCPGDFDKDGDTDGQDLSGLCRNPGRLGLVYFASDFGKMSCP